MPLMPKPAGPAVVFDDGATCENVRTNRLNCQAPIDHTKSGINCFGCKTNAFAGPGVFADFGTLGGGDNNAITAAAPYGCIPGGRGNLAFGPVCFAAGDSSEAGPGSAATALGVECSAQGDGSFAAGSGALAAGLASCAVCSADAFGDTSFAANRATAGDGADPSAGSTAAALNAATAVGELSFAVNESRTEGLDSFGANRALASGEASFAEGTSTTAIGVSSHAEGSNSSAFGDSSHAEGESCVANTFASHAEGLQCAALGDTSHAQGIANSTTAGTVGTVLGGVASHVQGLNGVARLFDSDTHGWIANTPGDAQHTNFFLFGISPGGGDPVVMTVIGAPPGTFNDDELHLQDNKVYKIKLDIVAHNRNPDTDAAATKWAEWNMSFLAYMVGGAAVVVGTITAVVPSEESPGPTGWTVTVTAVGDAVRVTFTSAAGDATPVQAFTYVQFLELGNPLFSPP